MLNRSIVRCSLLALAAAASPAMAQPFAIDWYTIDGGGGTSAGGAFSLSGTIGQADAGGPMTGGTFSLTGGFWVGGTTGPTCNDIDINNDGSLFDPTDIDAYLSVFSEGPCIPGTQVCDDIDFNNDGSLFDPCDIDSFLLVFSEGPCTLCGN
jgi:hypothetical protein